MTSRTRALLGHLDQGLGASELSRMDPSLVALLLGPFAVVGALLVLLPAGALLTLLEAALFLSLALGRAARAGALRAEAVAAPDIVAAAEADAAALRTAGWALLWTAGAFLALLT